MTPNLSFRPVILDPADPTGDVGGGDRWCWHAIIVNRRVRNAVLGCNLKNNRMISVCFQGKPFSIIVIQVYAPTTNVEEADVELFYEDLQDILEPTPKKKMSFSSHFSSFVFSSFFQFNFRFVFSDSLLSPFCY